MTQTSRLWDGTGVGDATVSPYDAATEIAEVLNALCGAQGQVDLGGVFYNVGSNFQASVAGGTVNIGSGQGIVYGGWLRSDATEAFSIPTPGAATRIDRIVMRKDWNLQTVRLVRLAGTEGGAAPNLATAAGNQWDAKLWRVSVTTAGVITLTDERAFLHRFGGAGSGLDADLLDGNDSPFYLSRSNHTGTQQPSTINPQGVGSLLNADMVDGIHAGAFAGASHEHDSSYVNEGQADAISEAMLQLNAITPTKVGILGDGVVTSRKTNLAWASQSVNAAESTSSSSFTDLFTLGPSVTLSPGITNDHLIMYSVILRTSVSGSDAIASPGISAAAASDLDGVTSHHTVYTTGSKHAIATAQANGTSHIMRYRSVGGVGATFTNRRMSVMSLGA